MIAIKLDAIEGDKWQKAVGHVKFSESGMRANRIAAMKTCNKSVIFLLTLVSAG